MKRRLMFFVLMVLPSFFATVEGQNKNTETACFKSSMHCAGCQNTIFELLRFEKGVKDLKVDHVSNTIQVVYDKRKNSGESLARAIEAKGFKAEVISIADYTKLTVQAKQNADPKKSQP